MKTLKKIKLINWHIFQNETILVNGNTLIFGENGSGKSTLIDAIHYVIDGGKDIKFNTAANTSNKNKRTIESYMRLKTGVEGKEYLRNGDVVSHIALEFFDTVSKESSVIGVCLELVKGNKSANERFYQLVKAKIDDSYYLVSNENKTFKVNNFSEFSKVINNKEIKMNVFDGSKRDNCAKIHRALGLYNDNSATYSILLNKAISFRPIDDVNEFVYSYLMPEKDIDLNSLVASIRSYREIKVLVDKEEEKKILLDGIITTGDELEAKEDIKVSHEYTLAERKVFDLDKEFKLKQNELKKLESEISTIESTKDFQEIEKANLEKSKYAYENNAQNIRYQNLISQKNHEIEIFKNLKDKVEKFNNKINFELPIIKYFNLDINLEKFKNSLDLQGFCKEISDYKQLLKEDLEPKFEEERFQLNSELKSKSETKHALLKEKENLENYRTDFKNRVGIDINGFIELVKNEFQNKFKKEIEIGPLCNYIEIKEEYEDNRNLLEQFLANRRFDIIVNGRYFDFVSQIYNENKARFESLTLIDLNKFEGEGTVSENSLYNYLEYNSVDAEKYVRAILGNAIEKESFNDFEFKNQEVLGDGFSYLNNKLVLKSRKPMKIPYIGFRSFKERLIRCLNEIELIDEEIKALKDKINDVNNKLNMIAKSNVEALSVEGSFVYPEFHQKEALINELDAEIKTLIEENQDLADISLKIEKLSNDISNKTVLIKNLERELSQKIAISSTIKTKIDDIQEQRDATLAKIDKLNKNPRLSLIKEKYYHTSNSLKDDEINKELHKIDSELFLLRNQLVENMNKYNHEFSEVFPAKVESFKDYKELYNKTIKNNLSKYRSQLEEAEEKAIQGFKEDYISKIRKYIQEEKDHIDKLNKVLKSKPFGTDGDVYEFIMQRNKNEELGRFYDIFTDSVDFEPKDLFSSKLDKKDEDALMELFDVFTSDKNNSTEKERKLRIYTDYRSFMSYDIKIKYSNDEVAYFSKVSNEKSGGETQTPFYIIIAASFEQIFTASLSYNKRESPMGLVILDEAFNNMDEQRIEAMISYFKTLNEQFLVVVPSQRAPIMMSYFDTTITLAKHNNRTILIEGVRQDE